LVEAEAAEAKELERAIAAAEVRAVLAGEQTDHQHISNSWQRCCSAQLQEEQQGSMQASQMQLHE
jgi:transcriptional regulator of acetoin/glycerol metabolism